MASLMDETFDVDKLSYEIFSILESKFLFENTPPESPVKPSPPAISGKVRILSIDAASDGGILAALSLSRLETLLKKQSGDPAASIADYFDIAAGSGAGGILAAMLFTRGQDGCPLFTAEESLRFINRNLKKILSSSSSGMFGKIFRKSDGKFKSIFSDATLRDTIKPVLISCFDMLTGSPFMFSRSDAVESDEYDFLIRDICAATCGGDKATTAKSVDGRTRIKAVGGGRMGMGNPTAAAITHVLNNKREFPFASRPEDLLVVSLGTTDSINLAEKLPEKITRIAGEGSNDMVDQSVAMAFGQNSSANYVRIQTNGLIPKTEIGKQSPISTAERALSQRHIESVLFYGKKMSDQTNGEKIQCVATNLIKEQEIRKKSRVPIVLVKPAVATPRTSSATTATTVTESSTATNSTAATSASSC